MNQDLIEAYVVKEFFQYGSDEEVDETGPLIRSTSSSSSLQLVL